jgi:hypothetical protein
VHDTDRTAEERAIAFEPGRAMLVCSEVGFAYLGEHSVPKLELDALLGIADRRRFLHRAVSLWTRGSTLVDFVAGLFGGDAITILAGGVTAVQVVTSLNTVTIDPSAYEFLTEQTVKGTFMSVTVTSSEGKGTLSYSADHGVLPVSSFCISTRTYQPEIVDLTVPVQDADHSKTYAHVATAGQIDDALVEELTIMSGQPTLRTQPVTVIGTANGTSTRTGNDVLGAYCTNGHFTDSRKISCLFCPGEVEFGNYGSAPRPQLGVLHFDTGEVVDLTTTVSIGRKPVESIDESIHVVAFSDDGLLSRAHVDVMVIDWDVVVVDRQSANGTFITYPDGRTVSARPHFETTIDNGTVVSFGEHSFRFQRTE